MDGRWESLRFPPAIAPPTRPSLLQPLFGACRGTRHPSGGRAAKIASCSLPGLRFSLRELWPSGLARTCFSPPVPRGAFIHMAPFEDGAAHKEKEGWLCRSAGTEPFPASGTNSPGCCRPGWAMDGDHEQQGTSKGGAGCTYRCWGASGDGRSGLLAPASGDLKEATALN